jgi:hypothetical protein
MKKCQFCGSENADDALVCSRCNEAFDHQSSNSEQVATNEESIHRNTTANVRGTLMPNRRKSQEEQLQANNGVNAEHLTPGAFTLTILPESGEQIMPFATKFEGSSIELNRNNTDRDNKTITSKVQARLVCVDGKWFIEDHSKMKTTFVRSASRIELHSGDVILMGDRQFLFDDLLQKDE